MNPSENTAKAARWEAVLSRAPGQFYYAVRTTGVFCRPSCASRRPRPENVEFFESTQDARSAGYRPCKRCRPEHDPSDSPLAHAVTHACELLSAENAMKTRDVATAVGLSESYFQRAFKKKLGVTPQQYRRRVLAERARESLSRGRSVVESVYEAGYSSSSRFYDGVGQELGMTPAAARAGASGERIEYAVERCSLGLALIAWTARGVCEVAFDDSEGSLTERLAEHFPNAELECSAASPWVEAVVNAVELSESADVPLDVRGTAFQERVWQALRAIPRGETRTYGEIAASLGAPEGARAVARACATNNLAVLIPCHRVVRKDGQPSGYRWGIDRKEALLHRERE
ncbi:MAG: bifunctional DNA-binding transcriptional regulator/O6-methylguanine-DNA methyltransferase Ada [Myxococcota bacterium]